MTTLPQAITHAKIQFVPNVSDGKGKFIKLYELDVNTISPLEVVDKMDITEFIESPISKYIFYAIIRDPYYWSGHFRNGTVNNLTILMRLKIAHSIGLYEIPILPIRETRRALSNHYTSLQAQLTTYFDQNISR